MKAIYLTKYGNAENAFETREVDKPTPGEGQVLIKVHSFGLNFADVMARRGKYPEAPKNPAVLGYDVAGTIDETGPGVHGLEPGDKVAALTRFGGYAEYAVTKKEAVARAPDEMDMGLTTALATQGCTAYYCAEDCVTMHEGDKVLIHAAAGGVGTTLVQLAKHRGCIVFGTASSGKHEYLREIGVDHPIDYTNVDFEKAIRKELGGNKLDVVFDSIGGKTYKKSWNLIGPGGAMVNFGIASQTDGNVLKAIGMLIGFGLYSPIQLLISSRSLHGVNMLRIADNKPQLFQKIFNNVMDLACKEVIKPTLGKKFKAENIAEAHAHLESRKSIGKIVVEW